MHVIRLDPASRHQEGFDQGAISGRAEYINIFKHLLVLIQQFTTYELPAFHVLDAIQVPDSLLHLEQAIRTVKIQGDIRREIFSDLTDVVMQCDAHIEDGDKDRATHSECEQRQYQ